MSRPFISVVASIILLFFLVIPARQSALADCRAFSGTIHNGSYGVADIQGQVISSCNIDQPFVPASIIKIVTALAAFHVLGIDHRFRTGFFLDDAGNLYIQGSGDPFLISEEVEVIAAKLKAHGLVRVNAIVIDNSMYDLSEKVPGQGTSDNPYDVPVAATVVNFNTVNIVVDSNGGVQSAEPQTPELPIMQELGKGMAPGTYRLNICRGGCRSEERTSRYTAELFAALLTSLGVAVEKPFAIHKTPSNARLVYLHSSSRSLEETVFSFLEYSNNYIANQVYLACGAKQFGYPVDWDKARKAVDSFLPQILGAEVASQVKMIDGAGLSRLNRATGGAVLKVLHAFKSQLNLLQERKDVNLKSGTLDGVYNYGGYLPNGRPFVILLNQEENTRDVILSRLLNELGKIPSNRDD